MEIKAVARGSVGVIDGVRVAVAVGLGVRVIVGVDVGLFREGIVALVDGVDVLVGV